MEGKIRVKMGWAMKNRRMGGCKEREGSDEAMVAPLQMAEG